MKDRPLLIGGLLPPRLWIGREQLFQFGDFLLPRDDCGVPSEPRALVVFTPKLSSFALEYPGGLARGFAPEFVFAESEGQPVV